MLPVCDNAGQDMGAPACFVQNVQCVTKHAACLSRAPKASRYSQLCCVDDSISRQDVAMVRMITDRYGGRSKFTVCLKITVCSPMPARASALRAVPVGRAGKYMDAPARPITKGCMAPAHTTSKMPCASCTVFSEAPADTDSAG